MVKSYDIVTAIDVCVDLLVFDEVFDLEFGQKEKLIKDYQLELGGSAAIFACQTAKLGLRTTGPGVYGKDFFGYFFRDKLERSGVETHYLKCRESVKTALGIAFCRSDDRAILTYPGTINADGLEGKLLELAENTRHLHIGSYYLAENLQPWYKRIVKKAKSMGATVSLDTNWDPDEQWNSGVWEILPSVDVFLPNENEIKALTGKSTLEEALNVLGPIIPVIVVKQGERGAVVYHEHRMTQVHSIDVEIVDTVGAGDSFNAGFLYGFLNGYNLETCLQIGSICGGMCTTKVGGVEGQITIDKLHQQLEISSSRSK